MANFDLVTFEDIYTNALRRVKGDINDSESIDKIKEIINTRYRQICNRKKWSFLRTDRSLFLPQKYTTGTMSLPANSRIVTGVGTAWTNTFKGAWFLANGSNISRRIVSVISPTQIILSSGNTENAFVAPSQYTIYQSELALFPNLEAIDDVRIDGRVWQVKPKGPGLINMMRQRHPTLTGRPWYYSIDGKRDYAGPVLGQFLMGYDFMGASSQQAISFFPAIPDQNYNVTIYYKLQITALVQPNDVPLLPIEHRCILFYYTLSDWYASNDNQMATYYQRLGDAEFEEMISKYVDTDDVLQYQPQALGIYRRSWMMRHSSTYFDTEG